MDVCTVTSSPPLFLEALSRLPPNHSSTPIRQSGRAKLSISPIRTLELSSPRLPRLQVSTNLTPSPSPARKGQSRDYHHEATLFRSQPAPALMVLKSPSKDPVAKTLFPCTPDRRRRNSFAAPMKSRIPVLQVSDASGKKKEREVSLPRPTLNRNVRIAWADLPYKRMGPHVQRQSSSLNDVKLPMSLQASAQSGESGRLRRQSSVGRRPASSTSGPSMGRDATNRPYGSDSSRPRAVGNIFNTTAPPDLSPPSINESSPFLEPSSAGGITSHKEDDQEYDSDCLASPTASLPLPGSLSNSSILSLTNSTASLPPPTPDDLESNIAITLDDAHTDGSSSYFNNVLPLQTAFQPTTIAKKYKPTPRDSGIGGLYPLSTSFYSGDHHLKVPNADTLDDKALVTPGMNPHPSWPTSNIRAALNLPPSAVPPTPAPPVMPPTPAKRPAVHFATTVGPSQSSAFLGRLKEVSIRDAPDSAPQASRARKHDMGRPSLPTNLPSAASFSAGRGGRSSPESSPSVRAARQAKHHEPTGAWPRKSVPLQPRVSEAYVSHPRREFLKRTTSSASAFSDASSSGDTVVSDDGSQDIDMLTPTRGSGGRIISGSGLKRRPSDNEHGAHKRVASLDYPSPPETSPLSQRTRATSVYMPIGGGPSGFGRASLDPTILHTPASPPAVSLHVPHNDIRGRRSFPLSKVEDSSIGRFERDFLEDGQLGRGGFALTYRVKLRHPAPKQKDLVWCVKRRKYPYEGAKDRQRQLEEVDILQYLGSPTVGGPHPNIVHMVDYWEQANTLYIRTELCECGDLSVLLYEYGRMAEEGLGEARVWKIFNEITSGVAHIHRAGILHLDLKPANIFITGEGVLKIGDFGLATRWPRPNAALERGFEREGDREYMAPEILRGIYGKAADIFSMGVIVLECVCNIVVPDMGEPWHKLRDDDFSDTELTNVATPEMASLVISMMSFDYSVRPTIEQIRANPIITRLESLVAAGAVTSAITAEEPDFLTLLLGRELHASTDDMDVDG